MAREELFPTQECPAFNNMKHTKNTHGVHLDLTKKYTILQHHKGQNLILIKGEQPAQRWVDDECFPKRSGSSNPVNVQTSRSLYRPALCPSQKAESLHFVHFPDFHARDCVGCHYFDHGHFRDERF